MSSAYVSQDGALVNGSIGLSWSYFRSDKLNYSEGIVVDFLTVPDAAQKDIRPPGVAAMFSVDPNVAWPVIEFIPAKHASRPQAKRVIIPQMSVDYLNASGYPEATRHQVPLILAWVSIVLLSCRLKRQC
jgi:hypothetical protein